MSSLRRKSQNSESNQSWETDNQFEDEKTDRFWKFNERKQDNPHGKQKPFPGSEISRQAARVPLYVGGAIVGGARVGIRSYVDETRRSSSRAAVKSNHKV
ncbi:hypothetical protein AB6A40_001979 [Gnathostoma spinigerum]|uniref:Uncharacterized protein n=1 Tax=Gnathostoma spinigerum TaxID=75299 RepID=A0ABD6EG37_9BILA